MTALKPADATKLINGCARSDTLSLHWKGHARDRLFERDLLIGDAIFLLKYGFVYDEGQPSTKEGFFKYNIESTTPNSSGRLVKATVIPDHNGGCYIKVITIMWKDE